MVQRDEDTQRLLAALMSCRTECLTLFANQMYAQGSPFIKDDRLITQVRGGTYFDALTTYIQTNDVDTFTTFLEGTTQQLIAGGFSYDKIRRMYTLLGQAILTVVRRELHAHPSFDNAIRTLNFALQLAQVVTLTQSSAQLLQRMSANSRAEVAPPPPVYTSPVQTVRSSGDSTQSPATTTGYLIWPLARAGATHPPEYKARLADGTNIQTLLVDDPQAYLLRGSTTQDVVRCTIRRIGPITLAYPL